jgi:hypothetical protein
MKRWVVGLLLFSGAAGCEPWYAKLQARAAFDLNCPVEQLEFVEIDLRTQGVAGCGQRATYVETYSGTWVLNSDVRRGPGSPPPVAPAIPVVPGNTSR